jgi:hypothetical protein
MSYDSIVITLILLVDSYMTFLTYKAQTRRERRSIGRRFNRVLKSMGYSLH